MKFNKSIFFRLIQYSSTEGAARALNKLILLILPFFLSVGEFGKIGLIVSIELVLPFLLSLSMERGLLKFSLGGEKLENVPTTITTIIFFNFLISISFLYVLYLNDLKIFFGLELFPHWILLFGNVFLFNIISIGFLMQRIENNHKRYSIQKIKYQLFKVFFVVLLTFILENELGYLLGVFIACLFFFVLEFKKLKNIVVPKFTKETFFFIISFSWPFIFHSIAVNLVGNADRLIMSKFVSLEMIGLYSLSFFIASSVNVAFSGITIFIEPMVYKTVDINEKKEVLDFYLHTMLILGAIFILGIMLLSDFFPNYEIVAEYREIRQYLPIIALSHLFIPFYLQGNLHLIDQKKSTTITIISTLSSIAYLILNFMLIPRLGIEGAGISLFVSFMLMGVLMFLYSNKGRISSYYLIQLSLILFSGLTIVFNYNYGIKYFFVIIVLAIVFVRFLRLVQGKI